MSPVVGYGDIICNASAEEAEAGGWQVQSQPGLHRQTLSSNKQTKASMLAGPGDPCTQQKLNRLLLDF